MTARLKLPRALSETVSTPPVLEVEGADVREALESLFRSAPGLRSHIVDESGDVRPHVSVFVDAVQADLATPIGPGSDIRIIQAVSGG